MKFASALLIVSGTLASLSHAAISVTSQSRYIEGQTINTYDGVPFDSGVQRTDATPGDFSVWPGSLTVASQFSVAGSQEAFFNGVDSIEITNFTMNISGGGGPGQEGWGTLTNHFAMTFDVTSPVNYTLNGAINMGPIVAVTLALTGPNTNYTNTVSDGPMVVTNVTGTLQPGSYTLSLHGNGTLQYTGPGGIGSGAGGTPNPMFTFTTSPATCAADLDNDGDFTNGGSPDGGVDINDLLYFLTAFESGAVAADLDNDGDPAVGTPDGGVDINDLLFFLVRFESGC